MGSRFTILPQAGPKPAPPQVPRCCPSLAPGEASVSLLLPSAAAAASHYRSGCHLGRALRCSGPGSTPRTGLAHSPGEHAARGGGLGHAPLAGPPRLAPGPCKTGICIRGTGGRERGVKVLPGRVRTLRNTCLSRPRLAILPHLALSSSRSWGSLPFGGTPGFCQVGLKKSKQCCAEPARVWKRQAGAASGLAF